MPGQGRTTRRGRTPLNGLIRAICRPGSALPLAARGPGIKSTKSKPAHKTLRICCFLTLLFSLNAYTQTSDQDMASSLSIEELITSGGRPTGPWPVGGLYWPLEELRTRPRDEVINAARQCLQDTAPQDNTHAFCVYTLLDYNVPDPFPLFAENFKGINYLGRFEALLHGYYLNDKRYAALFAEAVQGSMVEPPPNRLVTLAAMYASNIYHPVLLDALTLYNKRHEAALSEHLHRVSLNGFPYGDVIRLSVDSMDDALSAGLAFNRSMASIAETPMTPGEQEHLARIRADILEPARIDLPRQERTLIELIDTLNRAFSEQEFTLSATTADLSTILTNVGGNNLSAPEILASLCNDDDLQIRYGGYPAGWQIGEFPELGDFAARNNCTAEGNFLVVLEIHGRLQRRLRIGATIYSNVTWPRVRSPHFYLQDLTMDGHTSPINTHVGMRQLGQPLLNLPSMDLDAMPDFSVRATVSVAIPAHIKTIEQVLVPGMGELHLEYGPFSLEMESLDNEERGWLHWGVHDCCAPLSVRVPPAYNSGLVTFFDNRDNLIGQSGATRDYMPGGSINGIHETLKNSLPVTNGNAARLAWTVVPDMEILQIDVEFNDVQLVPVTPP